MFPIISIIIPKKPEGEVNAVIESLRLVDYPKERLEIIISEGYQPSKQRNEAVKIATGEILYFLDNDSQPIPQLFKKVIPYFEQKDIVGVGGPALTPVTDNLLQKSFDMVLCSIFAGTRHRFQKTGISRTATESELILCNLSFRKSTFFAEGGFNESLYPNEENELINRLSEKGYKFIYDPEVYIYRSQRRSITAFIRQIFSYGRGRAEHNFVYPRGFKIVHLLPLMFCLYLLFLIFYHQHILLYSPLMLYAAADLIASLEISWRKGKIYLVPLLIVLFPLTHISYGLGSGWGIIKKFLGIKKKITAEIKIKKVEI